MIQRRCDQYWNMDYNSRRAWIYSSVKKGGKKRPRVQTTGKYQRTCSRVYKLHTENGDEHFVCKLFFLNTLGYTSDKIITITLALSQHHFCMLSYFHVLAHCDLSNVCRLHTKHYLRCHASVFQTEYTVRTLPLQVWQNQCSCR